MAKEEKFKRLKEEFSFLKEKILGVLLFGSSADNSSTIRSDIDICIVAPKQLNYTNTSIFTENYGMSRSIGRK